MKPLELVIYPPLPPFMQEAIKENLKLGFAAHAGLPWIPGGRIAKRFTDAELAAEFWRAWAGRLDIDRLLTIERFATIPNYGE